MNYREFVEGNLEEAATNLEMARVAYKKVSQAAKDAEMGIIESNYVCHYCAQPENECKRCCGISNFVGLRLMRPTEVQSE